MAKIQMEFSYADTEFTRLYELDVADSLMADAKQKILNINASLKAGTDGGLSTFFVSDEGDNFTLISAAKFTITEEEFLDLNPANL